MSRRRYKQRRPPRPRVRREPDPGTRRRKEQRVRRRRTLRRARNIVGLLFLAILAVATIGGLVLHQRAGAEPEWWTSAPIPTPGPEADQLAQRVEKSVTAELSRPRPETETWSMRLTAEQANAWLNRRLPRWLDNQGVETPDFLGDAAMRFRDGGVILGFAWSGPGKDRIVGMTVRPHIQNDALMAPAARLHVGRLAVPADPALSQLPRVLSENAIEELERQGFLDILRGDAPLLDPAIITLDDGRRVRIMDVNCDDDRITLTFRNEPRAR